MTDEPIWVYVASNGDITAYDSRDRALDAARDDPGPFHIEPATFFGPQDATGAPSEPEPDHARVIGSPGGTGPRRRSWVSPPGLHYPDGHGVA